MTKMEITSADNFVGRALKGITTATVCMYVDKSSRYVKITEVLFLVIWELISRYVNYFTVIKVNVAGKLAISK